MINKTKTLLKDSATARWVALILVSLTMFFAYFLVDVASPIKNQLEIGYNWSSEVYGWYGGMEFFFNVFFGFLILSGIILDKMGIRFTLLTAGVLMSIGAAVKLYAIALMDRTLMVSIFGLEMPETALFCALGFAIFGVGVEMAGITVSKTLVKWFKGKELALAMGLEMSIARLGFFTAMWLSPIFANNASKDIAEWTTANSFLWAFIFIVIGFLCFFIYTFMDKQYDKEVKDASNGESAPEEAFKFSDLGKIFSNPGFLVIAGLCVLFYSAVFPWQRFATEILSSKLLIEPVVAARYVSILPIGAILLTPAIGFYFDKKGKGVRLMLYGAILLTITHLIFALVPTESFSTIVAMGTIIVLGVAFSLVPAALWPSLPKIIDDRFLGSAYGAIFFIQNIGLLLTPLFIGYVVTISNPSITKEALEAGAVYDYTMPELVFAAYGVLAIVMALVLKAVNKKKKYGLDLPNASK